MSGRTGVIVAGHGRFAEGMMSPLKMLAGIPDCFKAVEFSEGMSEEELEELLLKERDSFGEEIAAIILTDITGGTPFKMAVKVSMEREHTTVVAGVNLPVLIQLAVLASGDSDLTEALERAVEEGRAGLQIVRLQM